MKGLLSALARKLFSILLCNHPPMDKVHTPSKYSHPILGNATSRVCYAHSSLSMGISKAEGWFYLIYKPLLGNHSNVTSFARARHNSNCSLTSAQPWSLNITDLPLALPVIFEAWVSFRLCQCPWISWVFFLSAVIQDTLYLRLHFFFFKEIEV